MLRNSLVNIHIDDKIAPIPGISTEHELKFPSSIKECNNFWLYILETFHMNGHPVVLLILDHENLFMFFSVVSLVAVLHSFSCSVTVVQRNVMV